MSTTLPVHASGDAAPSPADPRDRLLAATYVACWDTAVDAAARIVCDDDVAGDLVQDVVLDLCKGRIDHIREPAALKSYMLKAVRRRAISWRERRQRRRRILTSRHEERARWPSPAGRTPPPRTFGLPADVAYERKEHVRLLASELERAMAVLPPKMCRAFQLVEKLGLDYAAAAEKMRSSSSTVANQVSEARKRLREQLSHLLSAVLILTLGL